MASSIEADLTFLELSGDSLFDKLEKELKGRIPHSLRKILILNDVNCVNVLANVDGVYKLQIENFVQNDLKKEMLNSDEALKDYLGVYDKCQQQFKFSAGQNILVELLVKFCKSFLPNNSCLQNPVVRAEIQKDGDGDKINSPDNNELETLNGERFREMSIQAKNDLSKHVGSLMISVFNDAKRTTLSGWSWPARLVTAEFASNFKLGIKSISNFDSRYVTPTSHAELLSCIVETDTVHIKEALAESLAVSVRLDGSVDRTQRHNVFVMAQVVTKTGTLKTMCLGFDIPKTEGAIGYLNCLKRISKQFLPWKDFFELISSLATDGESLNLGRLNGLVAKLKALRNSLSPNSPLISIWCVPHRTNLAWKGTSAINIIAKLIARATKLSKHFHNSGKRTQKLHAIAEEKGLHKPLRYPSFFAVRWVEYVFNLLNSVLRNWRALFEYFQKENLTGQLDFWIQYNTLHFLTFLVDVLGLVKVFQKACQSDDITLIDVDRLKGILFEKLENCKHTPVAEGWEALFLEKIVTSRNSVVLYNIQLKTSTVRTRTTKNTSPSFTPPTRCFVIDKFIGHLRIRMELDTSLLTSIQPLVSMKPSTSVEDLKICHAVIASDMDQNIFISEYYDAAALLNDDHEQPRTVLESLQKLVNVNRDNLQVIKTSLARISAAKPHSADVERLINIYNKFKSPDRSTFNQETLSNYLYVNTNMGPLEKFDPTTAVNYWMEMKERRPQSSAKAYQQKWYHVFFEAAHVKGTKQFKAIIKF